MNKRISKSNLNIFKDFLLTKNVDEQNMKLPIISINKEKKNNKKNGNTIDLSISNTNISNNKQNYKLKNNNMFSISNNKHRNLNTIEASKSENYSTFYKDNKIRNKSKLENKDKLKNIVNGFRELEDNPPNIKHNIKSHKENKKKFINNEISNTFTKFYRISRHQQKLDVIKLNTWDEDNLQSFYGNTNIIYQYLFNYYSKHNDKKKIENLEYLKTIIDNNGNFVDNILKSNANNKIIQNYIDQKNIEQGSILHNIISKTHYRFKNDLIVKDKKISLNFGIDNDALAAMKKEKEIGTVFYGKIIKEKEKQESAKREELMNLSIKILNKKKEKELKEKNIGKNYEETNNIIKKYNANILKIKDEIEEKKEYFNKIKSIQVREEDEMDKKNQLNEIQLDREKQELKLIRIKYELNSEIKKLDKKKLELNEEFEVCKNELLFMKIAHVYLTKEQRNYYLDLLNKGYDIRNEGLVWIVKRLLEIQTKLEYHHFPKYLDKDQADYIIELANLNLEEAQLKIVIDVLQKKQINLHNKLNKEIIQKILVLSNKRKTQIDTEIESKYKSSKNSDYNKDSKIYNSIKDVYKKYQGTFKMNSMKEIDDLREKKITDELKLSLLEGGRQGEKRNYDELTGLLDFFNKDNKDYFEFILKLKLRMRVLAKEKETLRQKQILLFRESLDNDNRFNYAESSLKYDLVWGALFGNRYNI